jgi:hypothetical protein
MFEAEFEITCAQCGGVDFQEVFPVPAEVYFAYAAEGEEGGRRQLTAMVYACNQCGHLEKFVDLEAVNGMEET